MKRKTKAITFFILGIFLIGVVKASMYCCEQTTDGAFCQNINDISKCSGNSKCVNTLCSSTSYCRPGTCINQKEGTCMSNVAQKVCENAGGSWSSEDKNSLPQCKLGCCKVGSQAAFVTKIACNKLGEDYKVTTSFDSSITDEFTCIETAGAEDEGACVFSKDYITFCERTTKKECKAKEKNSAFSNVTFHNGFLCSAAELGSICSKTTNTKCDENFDVRFVDGCGNLANIYDSSKINDENYWKYIQEPICGDNKGNKNSKSCGQCSYLLGSMCKEKEKGDSVDFGNYLCKDLDCKDYTSKELTEMKYPSSKESKYPRHGESWCATTGEEADSVGSSYFKLLCYNGEVTIEECDPAREEICTQTTNEYKGYTIANCKVNLWRDCYRQDNVEDCENIEKRDCRWISYKNYSFVGGWLQQNESIGGICVPLYAPGFERDATTSKDRCGLGSSVCYVFYNKSGVLGSFKCDEETGNCYCEEKSYAEEMNNICSSLGDCGVKKNYIGLLGKYKSPLDLISEVEIKEEEESS